LPFAEPAPGKPGAVRSPFRNGAEVLVPPLQWIEGGEVEDLTARRRFRLPKSDLPLLEAIPVTGRSLTVKSPFDTKAEIVVPLSDWTPGHSITCPTTDRAFVLPQHLEDPVLPAQLVEAQPGVIIDPYSNEEIQVPGPDWRENAIILSAQGHQILLPAKLPPLLAQIIDPSTPYHIRSPYDPNVLDIVPARKWTPGNIVKCGKRNVRLPDELPQPAPGTQTKSPFPLAAIATVCVLLLAAGAAALYFFPPKGEKNKTTSTEPSKPAPTPAPKPVDPVPSPPKPIVVAETPKPTPALTPKPAPAPPPPMPPTLREQFEKQKLAGKVTGDLLRDVLKQAGLKVGGAETQMLATDVLEFAKNQSDPETQQQALLAIAKRHGDSVTDAAFNAYLAAYKGSSSEARDWLVRNVDNLSAQFFKKAHGVLNDDDKAKFITAGKNAKKEEVAATSWYLAAETEMQTSGPQALAVLTAYREAAVRKHPEAANWLRTNVIAKPVPNEPLKVLDPFSADNKTIGIPAGKWKADTVIDDQFFKLGPNLAPLPATFIAGKHRTPEGDAKGIIDDPYKDGPDDTIEVERQNWYRGALLKEANIVLPDDLPLMEVKVYLDLVNEKSQPMVVSPLTKNPILLTVTENGAERPAWERWKRGELITELISQPDGSEKRVTTAVLPDMLPLDPKLSCTDDEAGETTEVTTSSMAQPPKTKCVVNSPYTGKRMSLSVKEWTPGAWVEERELKAAGVEVTFKLPPKLGPIFCVVEPSPAFEQFGMVTYWSEADTEMSKFPLNDALIKQLKENAGTFTRDEQTFKLSSRPDIVVVSKGKFRNPLTGESLDGDEVRSLRGQRNGSSRYVPYEFPPDVINAIVAVRVTPPQEPPTPTPNPPRPPATPGPTPPRTPVTPAPRPVPVQPTAPRAVADSRYTKSFVAPMSGIFFRYKNGTWQSGKGAFRSGGNVGDFIDRLGANVKGSRVPKSASITVNPDGSVVIQ